MRGESTPLGVTHSKPQKTGSGKKENLGKKRFKKHPNIASMTQEPRRQRKREQARPNSVNQPKKKAGGCKKKEKNRGFLEKARSF